MNSASIVYDRIQAATQMRTIEALDVELQRERTEGYAAGRSVGVAVECLRLQGKINDQQLTIDQLNAQVERQRQIIEKMEKTNLELAEENQRYKSVTDHPESFRVTSRHYIGGFPLCYTVHAVRWKSDEKVLEIEVN